MVRVVDGSLVITGPLTSIRNYYERSFSHVAIVKEGSSSSESYPSADFIYPLGKMSTLRLKLIRLDGSYEVSHDLTGLTPVLSFRKLPLYRTDWQEAEATIEMEVESPPSEGLCYVDFDGDELSDLGTYEVEILLCEGENETRFSLLRAISVGY